MGSASLGDRLFDQKTAVPHFISNYSQTVFMSQPPTRIEDQFSSREATRTDTLVTEAELISPADESITVSGNLAIDELSPIIESEPLPENNPWFMKKWVWALAAAGLLAIPASIYFAGVMTPKAAPKIAATPAPAINTNAVSALGRLEPASEVIRLSASSVQGSLLRQLLVKEGDKVTAGQVVAILDSSNTKQAQFAKAKEDVRVAQANLNKVKSGAKIGEISAQQAEVNRFQQQLRGETTTAQATLTRLKEQLIFEPQAQSSKIQSLAAQLAGEKPTYQARIDRLSAQFRNATVECQRYNTLFAQQVIEASRRDSKCLEPDTLQQQLVETKAQYQQSVSVLRQQIAENTATKNRMVSNLTQQIKEAESTYAQTVATLKEQIKQANANLAKVSEVRPVDVRAAEAEVASSIAAARQVRADLELAYVRAPIAGEVFKIYTRPGEATSSKGIVEIGQNDRMLAVAEIYESDIGKIKIGQVAEIKSETGAFKGTIRGTVSQIGLQIAKKDVLSTDPAADADSRVVEVKLALEPSDSDLVRGLTNSKVEVIIKN
jgi:HlyD family secretion protein